MNKLVLISLIFFASFTWAADPVQVDSVWVLDDSNFGDFIAKYENVMVEFYAPWCGHCKKLAPEYSAASEAVKDVENLRIANVDATEAKELANTYGIRGFPTLKFFKNGNPTDYQGQRTKQAIVDYCLKKSGPAVNALADNDALTALTGSSAVVVAFFGSADSDAYKVFEGVAGLYDDVVFGSASTEVGTANGSGEGAIALFKTFDEKRNDLAAGFTADSLKAFVEANSVPNVLPFNDKAIELVFHKQNPTVFLWLDEGKEGAADVEAIFSAAGAANKGKVVFSITKPTDGTGNYQKLADYVGADTANTPVVMLIKSGQELDKYKYEQEVTLENLNQYVADYLDGKLTKFLKSAPPPESNDAPVKVIVGSTFNEIVIDNTKDVLVEFYAPWCGHCKTLEPKYNEAAVQIAAQTNVVLAKCDATANEIPGIAIQGFPTLFYFPGNAKSAAPVTFDGARETADIITWLKEHASQPWVDETATKTEDL